MHTTRSTAITFAFALLWFLIPVVILWPGLEFTDAKLYQYYFGLHGGCSEALSESFMYACSLFALYKLSGHLGYSVLITAIFAAATTAYASFLLKNRYPKLPFLHWIPALTLFLYPYLGHDIAIVERDYPFGWLVYFCTLLLIDLRIRNRKSTMVLLGLCAALLPVMKNEGFLFWAVLAVEFTLLRRKKLNHTAAFSFSFATVFLLVYIALPFALEAPLFQIKQNVNGSPNLQARLLKAVSHRASESAYKAEFEALKEKLPWDKIENITTVNFFFNFNGDGVPPDIEREMSRLALLMCIEFPAVCFKERLEHLKILYSLPTAPHSMQESLDQKLASKQNSANSPIPLRLASLWRTIYKVEISMLNNGVHIVLLVMPLLVLSMLWSDIARAGLFVFIQYLVASFLTPQPFPRYIYSAYIASIFLVPFIVGEAIAYIASKKEWGEKYWKTKQPKVSFNFKNALLKLSACLFFVYLCYQAGFLGNRFYKTEYFYASIFVAMIFVLTVISAYRWRELQRAQNADIPSYRWFFVQHWISQSMALLFFGLVGADLYRYFVMPSKDLTPKQKIVPIVEDRLLSLGAHVYLFLALLFFTIAGFFALIPFIAIGAYIPKRYRILFALSVVSHFFKFAVFYYVFLAIAPNRVNWISFYQIALASTEQFLAISLEGYGFGHFIYGKIINAISGAALYHQFFAGKIIFKGLGLGILAYIVLSRSSKPRSEFAGTSKLVTGYVRAVFGAKKKEYAQ